MADIELQEQRIPTQEQEIQEQEIQEQRAIYELKPHQRLDYTENVQALNLIPNFTGFTSDNVCITSATGTGKTAQILCMTALGDPDAVIVIGPNASKTTWDIHPKWFHLEDRVEFHTYRDLVPNKNGISKANLLHSVNGVWSATPYFLGLLQNVIWIIYDEAHDIKNGDTDKGRAHHIINKYIRKGKYKNRILMLTATPTDKPELFFVFLHHLGIMKNELPYTWTREGLRFGEILYFTDGLDSIRNWLYDHEHFIKQKELDYDGAISAVSQAILNPSEKTKSTCQFLYEEIALDLLHHSMPNIKPFQCLSYTLLAKNLCTDEEKVEIESVLADKKGLELQLALGIRVFNSMAAMQKILKKIEVAKASLFARIVDLILTLRPNHKVVVQFNYYEAIDKFVSEITRLGRADQMCRIVGSDPAPDGKISRKAMKPADREKMRAKFQQDNNLYNIMLLSNVGQSSIDLDDQFGWRPRIILIVSTYNTIGMVQTMGRVWRSSTMSHTLCLLIFYSLGERLTKRHRLKVKTLMKTTRAGSIPITDNTPYATYDPETRMCSLFTVVSDTNETDRVLMNNLPLAEYNEEAHTLYRETNPIDITGFDTPKDRKVTKVTIEYNIKGKNKVDEIYVGTDIPIDKEYLDSTTNDQLLDQIYQFYQLCGLDKRIPNKIIDYETEEEQIANENIDYYFPGFREPVM